MKSLRYLAVDSNMQNFIKIGWELTENSFYGDHFENRYPNPTGHIKWILARSNDLKKKFITLSVKFIILSGSIRLLVNFITLSGSITLSGVITLLEQNSFYGGHFENKYPNPTGHIKWNLARSNDLKKKLITLSAKFITLSGSIRLLVDFITLSGSITLSGVITLLEQNIIIDIFQDIPLVFMAAILKIGIRIPLGIVNGF